MKNILDNDYNSYCTTMNELRNKLYKSRVRNECLVHNYKNLP